MNRYWSAGNGIPFGYAVFWMPVNFKILLVSLIENKYNEAYLWFYFVKRHDYGKSIIGRYESE